MNNRAARHVVNILMESPFYLELTLKERHHLITDLVTVYSLVSDNRPEQPSTEEPAADTE